MDWEEVSIGEMRLMYLEHVRPMVTYNGVCARSIRDTARDAKALPITEKVSRRIFVQLNTATRVLQEPLSKSLIKKDCTKGKKRLSSMCRINIFVIPFNFSFVENA